MKTTIKKIQKIIKEWGSFQIGEVENETSVLINEMGRLVALGESFSLYGVYVEVYDTSSSNSNSMESYHLNYEELSKDILEEILRICENYAVEQEKLMESCKD